VLGLLLGLLKTLQKYLQMDGKRREWVGWEGMKGVEEQEKKWKGREPNQICPRAAPGTA